MDVLVIGGHGKVAMHLLRLLAARGDIARGLIRNPAHAEDLEGIGAFAVIDDLEAETEGQLTHAVEGSDAVVFAAGAGPGSGAARKRTVDLGGALKSIHACQRTGVGRYVMVSAMGVDRAASYPAAMEPYLEAKREADEALHAAGLEHTIVRPGRLTDNPPTGLIEVGTPLAHGAEVTRADVAATLVEVLDRPQTIGLTFDLVNGRVAIAAAIAGLSSEPAG
jgi:uncharacterized protein YbjT (DUF2867 family)